MSERLLSHQENSDDNSEYSLNVAVHHNVRFRDELFGALLYRSDQLSVVLVNKKAFIFLKKAQEDKRAFSFDYFLSQSGATSEENKDIVKNLYKKLIQKNILV